MKTLNEHEQRAIAGGAGYLYLSCGNKVPFTPAGLVKAKLHYTYGCAVCRVNKSIHGFYYLCRSDFNWGYGGRQHY